MLAKLEGVQATVARLPNHAAVPAPWQNTFATTICRRDPARRRSASFRPALGGNGARRGAPVVAMARISMRVSHAEAGIAETGTLVLISGHENPTTLNFLPDNHIVVLSASDIVGDLEQIWTAHARKTYRRRATCRASVNMHHRPLALRRHRADAPARRAWPAPPACAGG
jgi:hypothetical protein